MRPAARHLVNSSSQAFTLHLTAYGGVPPRQSASFVAAMERVVALYAEAYDTARAVAYLDERPTRRSSRSPGRRGAVARAGLPRRTAWRRRSISPIPPRQTGSI